MYLRAFFYRIYLCLSRDFVNKHVFFAARFTFRQPKLPVGNATNLRTFRFITPFKRLFVLRDSLIRSLYFIQVYIFIPLIHSAPFLRFSHILLYPQFFLVYITSQNIFPIPDEIVVRNSIIIFIFSSRRPHLNYIFLSNVYSFATMEFSKKHKC